MKEHIGLALNRNNIDKIKKKRDNDEDFDYFYLHKIQCVGPINHIGCNGHNRHVLIERNEDIIDQAVELFNVLCLLVQKN